MQSTNIPSKIPVPFANSAGSSYKNTIPVASQIGITNGKASLTDGFPPLTFQAISSGGVPPFGADFNGILNEITAIQQWQEAGGYFPFDADFASTIGGYPKGAILQSNTFAGLWVSTIENNSNNPDTTGTGWLSFAWEGSLSIALSSTTTTLTLLQSAYPIITFTGTLTANSTVNVPPQSGEWIFVNSTTGAYTLTVKTPSGTGVTLTQGQSTFIYGDGTNMYFADSSKVASFNGRVGSVTLTSGDVTGALGFSPYNATNPAGYITQPNGLGWNGTSWHDVTASRGYNVTYTNSRSYPIQVCISAAMIIAGQYIYFYVDGTLVANFGGGVGGGGNCQQNSYVIVPPGSTYQAVEYGANLQFWAELY